VHSNEGRRPRSNHPRLLPLILLATLAGCGGKSGSQGQGGAGGVDGAAVGGAGGSSGGAGGSSDAGGAGGGGSSGHDGGTTDLGGSSTDAACDTGRLWKAVSDAALGVARLGYCSPATSTTTSATGSIVLDGEGRVIDNTGTNYLSTSSKQAWLDSLANDRWPCLAGQTIPYQCTAD
jgi:hypothetical protein